jgi:hypothetical protein
MLMPAVLATNVVSVVSAGPAVLVVFAVLVVLAVIEARLSPRGKPYVLWTAVKTA